MTKHQGYGYAMMSVGAILTLTVAGAIFGIPLMVAGFIVMNIKDD